MTALERLIKTASMDGAAHYRELAKEAQAEYDDIIRMRKMITAFPCASEATREVFLEEIRRTLLPNNPCTTTLPMAK